MTSIGSPSPFFLAGKKHTVERSLRFNYNDPSYLSRTPSNTSNRRRFTISWWFKLGQITASYRTFFGAYDNSTSGNDSYYFWITLTNTHHIQCGAWSTNWFITNRVFRDPTAWYHFVLAIDTENSTAADRVIFYVNGVRETSFSTQNNPSQNLDLGWNFNAQLHTIGRINYSNVYNYDGYMAEIYNVDGQQLATTSFAQTDTTTGQWIPVKCSASLGTNGFYLQFNDNSNTTATTLGKDSSSNSNNWTPNNFSVAAGKENDSLTDSPSHNFATLNWVNSPNSGGLMNGALNVTGTSGNWITFPSTMYVSSGKWYCEVEVLGPRVGVGIANRFHSNDTYLGVSTNSYAYFDLNHSWYNNSEVAGSYGATYTTGDVIGIALDMDNGTLNFYKNGVDQGQAFSGISGEYALCVSLYGGGGYSGSAAAINFGQRPFYNPSNVPSGYNTLSSENFADSTILSPRQHFDTLLYEGNASTQSITGLLFSPDWLWIKEIDQSSNHGIFDSLRGPGKSLNTNNINAEQTQTDSVTSFDANGFSLGDNTDNGPDVNYTNLEDFVAWNWNAGSAASKTYTVTVVSDSGNKYRFDGYGTSAVTLDLEEGGTYIFNYPSAHPFRFSTTSDGTHGGGAEYTTGVTVLSSTSVQIVVPASAPTLHYYCTQHSGMGGTINTNSLLGSSNFNGSIISIVKANTTAGFSIIKYIGTGSAGATVGHGLGVAPDVIVHKNRNDSSASFWSVYHKSAYNSASDPNIIYFNTNAAQADDTNILGTSVTIDSTKFSLGDYNGVNGSNDDMVSYCFSSVSGFSNFGKYVGNGSSAGNMVFLGFRPAFVMQKRIDSTGHWYIFDNKRNGFNVDNDSISPDLPNSEYDVSIIDFTSMGFVWKTNAEVHNASGATYIFMAFSEAPFKYSRAR